MSHSSPVNLATTVSQLSQPWTPIHLLTVNATHSFKLATIRGNFIWHSHPNSDEVFYIVSGGPLRMEIATDAHTKHERDGFDVVELKVGDLFNVPRGVRHRPVSARENGEEVDTGIMMVELVGTVNTGDEQASEDGMSRTVQVKEA